MKKTIVKLIGAAALFLLASHVLNAQKASPPAEAKGKVGSAEISIKYHQPGVKDREIWGGLVPYDNVWRTGANNAVVVETTGDIKVGGKELKAGKYGLWSIPGEKDFTWIFSKTWDTWGTNYDPSADVLRVTGDFEKGEEMERMTMAVEDGAIKLMWAGMVASVPVEQ